MPGKLTKRLIDGLVPRAAQFDVWDQELRGFGVRVSPTGLKTFVLRFRPRGTGRAGPKRFLVVGRFGTMTIDQARDEAKNLLGQVARGDDPTAGRQQRKIAPTFSELAERYLSEHVAPRKKPSTTGLYRHYLCSLADPILGAKKAVDVTFADVARLHGAIGATRQVTANRVVKAVSGAYSFGGKVGATPPGFNPAKGIEGFREQPRERYLSTAELARLGSALVRAETVGLPYSVDPTKPTAKHAARPENRLRPADPSSVAAIRLLLLTGARLREILHARWDYVDLERGLLLLPDSKTGRKVIFLSAQAVNVIVSIPREAGTPFLFPGRCASGTSHPAPRADLKKPWAAICEAADLQGLRLHDLRHSFASIAAGSQMGLPIIGKLLGHSQPQTTARYAHLDADPMHRAVNSIGLSISKAIGFNSPAPHK